MQQGSTKIERRKIRISWTPQKYEQCSENVDSQCGNTRCKRRLIDISAKSVSGHTLYKVFVEKGQKLKKSNLHIGLADT